MSAVMKAKYQLCGEELDAIIEESNVTLAA
jgi:hypothetical protein